MDGITVVSPAWLTNAPWEYENAQWRPATLADSIHKRCRVRIGRERALLGDVVLPSILQGRGSGRWHTPYRTQPLLFSHLCQCESRRGRDRVQHWMQRVYWHAQLMCSFPRTNAQVRGVHRSTLLCQIHTPAFRALELLKRAALAIIRERLIASSPRWLVCRRGRSDCRIHRRSPG